MRKNLIHCVAGVTMLTVIGIGLLLTPAASPDRLGARVLAATDAATVDPIVRDGSLERPFINPCTHQLFHTIMTNAGFKDVQAVVRQQGKPTWAVTFTLADNDEARAFVDYTETHIGQQLAIVLDGKVLSAPVIQSALPKGGDIVGNFTREQAMTLATQLKTGALPTPLIIVATEASGTGGTGVLLEAAPGSILDKNAVERMRQVIIARLQALEIKDPKVDIVKNNQIAVDIPGGIDPLPIIRAISSQGLLEMVDFSKPSSCTEQMPMSDQYIVTDGADLLQKATPAATAKPTDTR